MQGKYNYLNLQIRNLGLRLNSWHEITEREAKEPRCEANPVELHKLILRVALPPGLTHESLSYTQCAFSPLKILCSSFSAVITLVPTTLLHGPVIWALLLNISLFRFLH